MNESSSRFQLSDGSRVAVVGAGPAGSLFSYLSLDMADRLGRRIEVDLYDSKDFNRKGPAGCNHCGGVVSESLVQILATEGINIPASAVYRGIDSYVLHTDAGSVRLETPVREARIAAMHRGGGPLGGETSSDTRSFDGFLQEVAVAKGARFIARAIREIRFLDGKPEIATGEDDWKLYDLVVGAVGLNPHSLNMFAGLDNGYQPPRVTKTAIREFYLGREAVQQCLGNSMHTFLLNLPRLKFAALIPKGDYATLVMLGDKIDNHSVRSLLEAPAVKRCFPADFQWSEKPACQCYPRINIGPAVQPYGDRFVMLGDCGVSKLYKNGIGAAYMTAKAAASTAILHGVSGADFHRHYGRTCRRMDLDNRVGKLVFLFTALIQKCLPLKRAVLRMVLREQPLDARKRRMSRVLWDAFTGSAPYVEIFLRTLHPAYIFHLARETVAGLFPFYSGLKTAPAGVKSRELGRRYGDGEVIVREGEAGDCLFVIQSGTVAVSRTRDGREVPLSELGAGEFFGEMALFTRTPRSATVTARGEVRALTVDKTTLMRTIQEHPALAFRLLERLSRRIEKLDQQFSQDHREV